MRQFHFGTTLAQKLSHSIFYYSSIFHYMKAFNGLVKGGKPALETKVWSWKVLWLERIQFAHWNIPCQYLVEVLDVWDLVEDEVDFDAGVELRVDIAHADRCAEIFAEI